MNLQVHAGFSFRADHAQQCADGLGGLALAADDLAHIFRMQVQGNQDPHLINRAFGLHVFRMVNQSLNYILYEFLILFLCHICNVNCCLNYNKGLRGVNFSAGASAGAGVLAAAAGAAASLVFSPPLADFFGCQALTFFSVMIFFSTKRLCTVGESFTCWAIQYFNRSSFLMPKSFDRGL